MNQSVIDIEYIRLIKIDALNLTIFLRTQSPTRNVQNLAPHFHSIKVNDY